jgi:hypothetical protein
MFLLEKPKEESDRKGHTIEQGISLSVLLGERRLTVEMTKAVKREKLQIGEEGEGQGQAGPRALSGKGAGPSGVGRCRGCRS